MLRSGAGHSNDADGMFAVEAALSEAMKGLGDVAVDAAFLFLTYHHMGDAAAMVDVVIDRVETEAVFGCSGMGVLTDARENDREPGVAVLVLGGDHLEVTPLVAEGDDAGDSHWRAGGSPGNRGCVAGAYVWDLFQSGGLSGTDCRDSWRCARCGGRRIGQSVAVGINVAADIAMVWPVDW